MSCAALAPPALSDLCRGRDVSAWVVAGRQRVGNYDGGTDAVITTAAALSASVVVAGLTAAATLPMAHHGGLGFDVGNPDLEVQAGTTWPDVGTRVAGRIHLAVPIHDDDPERDPAAARYAADYDARHLAFFLPGTWSVGIGGGAARRMGRFSAQIDAGLEAHRIWMRDERRADRVRAFRPVVQLGAAVAVDLSPVTLSLELSGVVPTGVWRVDPGGVEYGLEPVAELAAAARAPMGPVRVGLRFLAPLHTGYRQGMGDDISGRTPGVGLDATWSY